MLKFKTPDQIIAENYNRLKQQFSSVDLRLHKGGFVGYLLHLMGWTLYDANQYYAGLYYEMFPETCQDVNTLLFHASRYGYFPSLARPSTLVGTFRIYRDIVNVMSHRSDRKMITCHLLRSLTDSRLPYLAEEPSYYQFSLNDLTFTFHADYYLVYDVHNDHVFCRIVKSDGSVTIIPIYGLYADIPVVDVYQYEVVFDRFRSPFYARGSTYRHVISNVPVGKLYDLKVYVYDEDNSEWVEYDVRYTSFGTYPEDKVVFLRQLSDNYILELGDGTYGAYIPDKEILIAAKVTEGNLKYLSFKELPINTDVVMIVTYDDDSQDIYETTIANQVLCTGSNVGGRIYTIEDLRREVISFIQSRGNLVSFNDFVSLLKNYFDDFVIAFKKVHVFDNTFYLYLPFKDMYQQPIKTTCKCILRDDFNPFRDDFVYMYEHTIFDDNYVSPFLWVLDRSINAYLGYYVRDDITITVTDSRQYIDVFPPPIVINVKYENQKTIFTISSNYVMNNKFIDLFLDGEYKETKMDEDYVFVYEYVNNETFSLFFEPFKLKIALYDSVVLEVPGLSISSSEPNKVTGVDFTSLDVQVDDYFYFQDDDEWKRVRVAEVTAEYVLLESAYTGTLDEVKTGIFLRKSDKIIEYYSEYIEQVIDLSYNLKLPHYIHRDQEYVVSIPFVNKRDYEQNKLFFENQLISTYRSLKLDYNTMMSDDVQIRFANTVGLDNDELLCCLAQSYPSRIKLPLSMIVTITYNSDKILDVSNLDILMKQIKIDVSQLLIKNYTRINLEFYSTDIVTFLRNKYDWIEDVKVEIYDRDMNRFVDFKVRKFDDILSCLFSKVGGKFRILDYTPLLFWWDINNLEVKFRTYDW